MTKFVNLTPHPLSIVCAGLIRNIPPSGTVARVTSSEELVKTIDGINIVSQTFSDVAGLPAAERDVFYIVSRMVKDRVNDRADVLVPGAPVRDSEGRIVGASGLSF